MAGGVILYTKDAGLTWEVQLGDPESNDRAYRDLRFVDATTGFAVQSAQGGDHRLLRTTDGQNWTVSGGVAEHRNDYTFVSATKGFQAYQPGILRTEDAGRTWKPVLECRTTVEVEGLNRQVDCEIDNLSFLSPEIGFGIGYASAAPGVFLARTTDGGATWKLSVVLPEESGREAHIRFVDQNNGFACLERGGKLVGTSDGGTTWSVIPGPSCTGKVWVKFAGQTGWTLVYKQWNFSTNGGRRWTSRQVAFPAMVAAFALPQSDRGYAVGDHGMIYRYRVVPDTATLLPRAITVPAMPRATAAGGAP
jgi:photosystem II stability/assembly factor-like uncharacterized protein